MQNIKTRIEGTKLIIEVDLAKRLGPSKSGKTVIIASTYGNIAVPNAPDGIVIGMNVWTKEKDSKPQNG